jgi:hypothetical protein
MTEEILNEVSGLVPWEPHRFLRTVPDGEVRLSRGFLRCRPEKWFPGFGAQWLPLAHALGVEFKALDVKTMLHSAALAPTVFIGSVDGEAIALSVDPASARVIADAVTPGMASSGDVPAVSIVLEYLARRFLTSLSAAWTGPESSTVLFEPEMTVAHLAPVADVRLSFALNGTPCQVIVSVGRFLVERLDVLWRRQVHSTARAVDAASDVALEIAQLAVPPSMLADYLRSGTLIDLEVRASDGLILRAGSKAWQAARGCLSNGRYAFEIIGAVNQPPALPEGTTRLSITFGSTRLEGTVIAELAQSGALWETGITASDAVELRINGEVVGEGRLGLYEGRFAVTVA